MQDSGLGPGIYNLKSFTELILSRRVSKRGSYDLSTGNGNLFTAPVRTTLVKTKDTPPQNFCVLNIFLIQQAMQKQTQMYV